MKPRQRGYLGTLVIEQSPAGTIFLPLYYRIFFSKAEKGVILSDQFFGWFQCCLLPPQVLIPVLSLQYHISRSAHKLFLLRTKPFLVNFFISLRIHIPLVYFYWHKGIDHARSIISENRLVITVTYTWMFFRPPNYGYAHRRKYIAQIYSLFWFNFSY